jgi:hypothetical protein
VSLSAVVALIVFTTLPVPFTVMDVFPNVESMIKLPPVPLFNVKVFVLSLVIVIDPTVRTLVPEGLRLTV